MLNRYLWHTRLRAGGTTACLWIWANLGYWHRWYDFIGVDADGFGFPLPYAGYEWVSWPTLGADAGIGVLVLLIVCRRRL